MKRITSLALLTVLSGVLLSAQPSLPAKCEVFYPDILQSSAVLSEKDALALERSSDFGQSKTSRNAKFWVVFSDRDENTTYTTPGGSTKFSSLGFNQQLRIAQIKNGYALVYTEPQEDIEYPLISQYAECKGWVSMKKLLLWHSCLADNIGIYQKALLCVNLDEVDGSDLGNLYYNPQKKDRFKKISTDMRFYFVMKREDDLALLASTHSMEGTSDKALYGWVPAQSYVPWNQRSCLEPNWNHRDVEYFAENNVKIRICEAEDLEQIARPISFKKHVSKPGEKYDRHLYRMNPDELRFPILDYHGSENIYNCSSFGTPGGGQDEEAVDEIISGTPLGFTEQQLNEMLNINIGVVIDGTSSMETFYPAVQNAIREGRKFFGSKYKVKVGVVIYRDYSDGEFMTEFFPLTNPDNPRLDQFLHSGGRYGVKSASSDRTLEEAMYQGISTALDKIGFKPDQSNLLLVVGDCGNDRADEKVKMETIVDKLIEKNVNIMGFQVRNGAEDAFGLFNNQLQQIMKLSLERKFSKLAKSEMKVRFQETKDGYRMINDRNSNLYIGSHSFPLSGQQMQIDKLSSLMQESIMYCSESVEYQIDLLDALRKDAFVPSPDIVGVDLDEQFLIGKLGQEVYDKIKKSNSLIAFRGYSLKTHKSGRPFFKPVVFLSSDELNELIERLAPVNNAAVAQTNDREPYVNAMKALIQSMVPDITDERMNAMGYNEVMATVAGLNEAATALKGPSILEIANPQAVSHTEYASLVSDFRKKFQMLQRLKSTPYKYTRVFNGLKYYWLPVEDLP